MIDAIEGRGMVDVFRHKHPQLKAWTREPQGDLAKTQTARLLDRFFVTAEVGEHLATRIGIHRGFPLESDHLPMVIDLPNDGAGIAERVVPVWDPVTVTKIVRDREPTDTQKADFSDRVELEMAEVNAMIENGTITPEGAYKAVMEAMIRGTNKKGS